MGEPAVVGLDLSLTSTGAAVISPDYHSPEVVRFATKGGKSDTLEMRGKRLRHIADDVLDFCYGGDDTDLVVIESPSYGSKFGSPHDRSGLWWMVVSALQGNDIEVATVTPMGRAMYGTGKGNSKKVAVTAAVMKTYAHCNVEWPTSPKKDDVADALLLAAMGRRYLGHPIEVDLPATHTRALDGAAWPIGWAS